MGPGQADLLTLRALQVIDTADAVFVPVADTESGPGRAEAVVRAARPDVTLRRLTFSMSGSAGWDAAAAAVVAVTDAGGTAAFCTLGDPNVYSTFTHLRAEVVKLRPELPVATVPGITAMQVLAAAAGRPLVDGRERLALVPMLDGPDVLERALAYADCVVLYKGGRHLGETLEHIRRHGLDAVYGELLGTAGERVAPAASVDQPRGPYLSTVIAWRATP